MYQGTRETKSFLFSHPSSRSDQTRYTRDVGLSKRVTPALVTFSGFTISDAGGSFGVFKVGDMIAITGTTGALNNGDRTILAVNPTAMTVDFPVKTEGPVAGVEIRTQSSPAKGERAVLTAMMYPALGKRGRGNKSKLNLDFSTMLLSQARTVLRYLPETAQAQTQGDVE